MVFILLVLELLLVDIAAATLRQSEALNLNDVSLVFLELLKLQSDHCGFLELAPH